MLGKDVGIMCPIGLENLPLLNRFYSVFALYLP